MLARPDTHGKTRQQQAGVVLIIALIVLVAMTLAGIALVRSMDTTNIIAGNLAFRQAAVMEGDAGTEAAVAWLEANNGNTLWTNSLANGYAANRVDPNSGESWDAFWLRVLQPNPPSLPIANLTCSGQACTLPTDTTTGNTVSYAIQRMCADPAGGDPLVPGSLCAATPAVSAGRCRTAGCIDLLVNTQVYYRITSRIVGPRNTVSYTQSVVAL
ncbi:MAG: hypothetical protein HY306_01150 [Nitrosomonadales bacterium]|nr:hypothetical protein [Nitrosomonadales bacterium]